MEVVGLSGLPEAGDMLTVTPDDNKARELAETRRELARLAETCRSLERMVLPTEAMPRAERERMATAAARYSMAGIDDDDDDDSSLDDPPVGAGRVR